MQITFERLRELIETLRTGQVGEFEYEDEQIRMKFVFGQSPAARAVAVQPAMVEAVAAPAAAAATAAAASAAKLADENVAYVTSPFVGTFYRSASPETAAFVDVGSSISVGQTLCIVEAMKLMNEIESDVAGTIVEILVDNGVSVEFGQKLFKVSKR
jgi:acetyl-CoA carboxylase biotin carboxyl carrier protein